MNLSKTLIVSHDAGGAFLLSKWCRDFRHKAEFEYHLKGPAIKIFKDVMPSIEVLEDVVWNKVTRVITATGWQTEFEISTIEKAKENGIYVVSYLDHWANYMERFSHNGSVILPDEIWLADREAMKVANNVFSKHSIKLRFIRNRHFSEIKLAVSNAPQKKDSVLICLEPIRNGYSLKEAYKVLKSHLINNYNEGKKIIIRDHPAGVDTGSGYLSQELSETFDVEFSKNTLEIDIANAERVYGYQSSVLAYASYLGVDVFSYYPKYLYEVILPHKDISYI